MSGLLAESIYHVVTQREAWPTVVHALDLMLRAYFHDVTVVVYPAESTVPSALAVAWLLGQGVVVAEYQLVLTEHGGVSNDIQIIVWVLEDRSGDPLKVTVGLVPRDGRDIIVHPVSPETEHTIALPIRTLFPFGLDDLIHTAVPDLDVLPLVPCRKAQRPGQLAAIWRIPYPEQDVRAHLPFCFDRLALFGVVEAEAFDGSPLTLHADLTPAAGDWGAVPGWPSPGYIVPMNVVVYPRVDTDWEHATLQWEDEPAHLLVLPLGGETLVRLFGGILTGPVLAAQLEAVVTEELRAERVWRDIPIVGWPGRKLLKSSAQKVVVEFPSHWPQWVTTFHYLYREYLRGQTMDWVAEQLRNRHPDFSFDGDYLRRWLSRERNLDPDLVNTLFPFKDPERARAIRRARNP